MKVPLKGLHVRVTVAGLARGFEGDTVPEEDFYRTVDESVETLLPLGLLAVGLLLISWCPSNHT